MPHPLSPRAGTPPPRQPPRGTLPQPPIPRTGTPPASRPKLGSPPRPRRPWVWPPPPSQPTQGTPLPPLSPRNGPHSPSPPRRGDTPAIRTRVPGPLRQANQDWGRALPGELVGSASTKQTSPEETSPDKTASPSDHKGRALSAKPRSRLLLLPLLLLPLLPPQCTRCHPSQLCSP